MTHPSAAYPGPPCPEVLSPKGLAALLKSAPSPMPVEIRNLHRAVVFLLLFFKQEPFILFIVKADNRGYPWRNQVAFPGGHVDPGDPTPLAAAFRELTEELAIGPEQVTVSGNLGHFQTINNMDLEVFTGFWDRTGPVKFDPSEISRITEASLSSLAAIHKERGYTGRVPDVDELVYPIEGAVIWGVTARILHHFLELLLPRL